MAQVQLTGLDVMLPYQIKLAPYDVKDSSWLSDISIGGFSTPPLPISMTMGVTVAVCVAPSEENHSYFMGPTGCAFSPANANLMLAKPFGSTNAKVVFVFTMRKALKVDPEPLTNSFFVYEGLSTLGLAVTSQLV